MTSGIYKHKPMSVERRKHLSEYNKQHGIMPPLWSRRKAVEARIRNKHYGHSEEWKINARKRMSGINNPMYGKGATKGSFKKGHILGMIGKHHTEETKQKISMAKIGKKMSEESKIKLSLAKKGQPNIKSRGIHQSENYKKGGESKVNNHKTLKYLSEIFGVKFKDLIEWKEGKKSFEKILNLSPSEDSTIVHFLIPLLKEVLGYSAKDIDIKPILHINQGRKVKEFGGESDVVVRKAKKPVFVIEAKKYSHSLESENEDAEGQAYDYSRANELKPKVWYHIISNVKEIHIYDNNTRKEVLSIKEEELDDKLSQLISLLHKDKITPLNKSKTIEIQTVFRTPVKDKKEFERLLFKCQDYMREAEEAKTGKEAFDEMNKILFIKIFEDRRERNGEENRFTTHKISTEGENYIKGTLFEDIKKDFKKRGTPIFNPEDEIKLDSNTVNLIVKKLQTRFLVDEDGKVYEPIGEVYENFVSTIFRGENGQYFTPRPVVDFIIKMTGIKWGEEGMKICDPCCGSGGFLLYVFEKLNNDLKKEFMNENLDFKSKTAEEKYIGCKGKLCKRLLTGFDNEKSVSNTAMMNMSVHGDGSVGIYYGNSLLKQKTKQILTPNSFDCVVTNPPFSVNVKKDSYKDVDDKDVLESYDLGHTIRYNSKTKQFEEDSSEDGIRQNQDSKKLFIERCHHLLKPKKYLGIVIDDGVLNNPSDAYLRDWIYTHFIIKAVVSLPFEIFKERGATNRTSILILQKKEEKMIQGDIFMAIAKHAGENYGKLGWKMPNNLDEIYHEWLIYNNDEKFKFQFLFIVKKDELENYFDESEKIYRNRIDPKFYNPVFRVLMKKIEKNNDSETIDNLIDFEGGICEGEDVNSFGSRYIDKITNDGRIEIGIIDGVNDPKGDKNRIFKAGDLVASRINIKSGMIGFIPEVIEEIRATDEYYKFVPKLDEKGKPKILKEYLFIVLTSRPIQLIMNAIATGQYMRLEEKVLAKIKIPVPTITEQERIIKEFWKERAKASQLKRDAINKIDEINSQVESMIINGKD